MRKTLMVVTLVVALAVAWTTCWAQEKPKTEKPKTDGEPKFSVSVDNKSLTDAAAEAGKQLGLTVLVVDRSTATVTLDVKDVKLEDAIAALADAGQSSWMRLYILERTPPATPYTGDQLAAMVQTLRAEWMATMTREELQDLRQQWADVQQMMRDAGAPPMPGAGFYNLRGGFGGAGGAGGAGAPGAGAPGGGGGRRGGFGPTVDAIAPPNGLVLPVRADKFTLSVTSAPVKQLQYAFMRASGFFLLADEKVTGTVTVDLKNAKMKDVLAKIADATATKVRTVYLLTQPRPMTQDEQQAQQDQQIDNQLAQFWQMTPEERAQWVQNRVQQISRWADAAAANPGSRAAQMLSSRGPRMLDRMARGAANLTAEQRMELKPVMQALGRAINRARGGG